MNNKHLLSVEDIYVGYGEAEVLHGVSMYIDAGETVTIIGANGVGKTTLLKSISGLVKIKKGGINLDGIAINKEHAYSIRKLGLSFVECRGILRNLSVKDNLILAASNEKKQNQKKAIEEIFNRFPRLKEREKQTAASLSGGEQQILAIALGLLGEPRCLMLDEPSLGLAPLMVNEVFVVLKTLKDAGKTLLVVEQNARQALNLADRAYVLELGKFIAEGKTETILNDKKIVEAYLGL